jgi:hypothetical protein
MRSSTRNRFAGDQLAAALNAAELEKTRKGDVAMTSVEGTPVKSASRDFGEVGQKGEFATASNQYRGHFDDFTARLQAFDVNAGLAQPASSVA